MLNGCTGLRGRCTANPAKGTRIGFTNEYACRPGVGLRCVGNPNPADDHNCTTGLIPKASAKSIAFGIDDATCCKVAVTPTAAAERAALLTAFTNIPSWAAATDAPCGAGWNDFGKGWRGINCDKLGGRVTQM